MDEQTKQKRPTYSDGFKRDAVRLVAEEGYSSKRRARRWECASSRLRAWHAKLVPPPKPCGEDASHEQFQAEIKRLRRQLKQAEMERDILKKATAFFAKEST